MPAFCARWPDGTFSIVEADDETHALIQLDHGESLSIAQRGACPGNVCRTPDGRSGSTLEIRTRGDEHDSGSRGSRARAAEAL